MRRASDITGNTYNRLTAIRYLHTSECGNVMWEFRCECGTLTVVVKYAVINGRIRSCGCIRKERCKTLNYIHGHTANHTTSATWRSWCSMMQRCGESRPKFFKHYKGKGITVCDRWLSFNNFLSDMGERPPNTTLDRIDNSKGYEPANCRWENHTHQANNRTNNLHITFDGITKTLAQWSRIVGVRYGTLHSRLYRGWDIKRSLTTPETRR